jgi:hypothetical protein
VLLKSTIYNDFQYRQVIKSESITEAIDIVLEIVDKYVLNRLSEFEQLRKAKEIELLENQVQKLIEQANKLK